MAEQKLENKDKQWWDALYDWEKKWKERRQEERRDEALLLKEAEEEYERFSRPMKVLDPPKKAKLILATQSREPGWSKMRLRSMKDFQEGPPFLIKRIDYYGHQDKDADCHLTIRITPLSEFQDMGLPVKRVQGWQDKRLQDKKGNASMHLAFSLRKALEFQTNEKIDSILEEAGAGEFSIKALDGATFIPLCRVFCSPSQIRLPDPPGQGLDNPDMTEDPARSARHDHHELPVRPGCQPCAEDQIIIEVQTSSFPYFHNYFFSIQEIVQNYLVWLHSASHSSPQE
ncbi:MAG: hypothetical protein AB1847_16545 [bacterium]